MPGGGREGPVVGEEEEAGRSQVRGIQMRTALGWEAPTESFPTRSRGPHSSLAGQ